MIWALIRKDLSLLRLYLRSLVGVLIACFVAAAILIFWDVRDAGQSFADSRFMIASILAGGSLPGLIVVTIFSASRSLVAVPCMSASHAPPKLSEQTRRGHQCSLAFSGYLSACLVHRLSTKPFRRNVFGI
jgi:hypothetical protein